MSVALDKSAFGEYKISQNFSNAPSWNIRLQEVVSRYYCTLKFYCILNSPLHCLWNISEHKGHTRLYWTPTRRNNHIYEHLSCFGFSKKIWNMCFKRIKGFSQPWKSSILTRNVGIVNCWILHFQNNVNSKGWAYNTQGENGAKPKSGLLEICKW